MLNVLGSGSMTGWRLDTVCAMNTLRTGNPVPGWFLDGQNTDFCSCHLAMQLTLAVPLALPWGAGSKTRQEQHLGNVFPVIKLASAGHWSVI